MAISSTSFQIGNQASAGKGRKGFEFEEAQKKKMGKILNRALALTSKIENGKATEKEIKRFQTLSSLTLKIMDKFHANKSDIKLDFDRPLLIKKAK